MKQKPTRMKATWVMALLVIYLLYPCVSWAQDNEKLVKNLKPKKIWENFARLSSWSRCSGQEGSASDSLVVFAKKNNEKAVKDEFGNVLVLIPASSAEYETKPSICIQAHIDRVCDANPDVKDPLSIKFKIKGDTLSASGTTLGADDGIGEASEMVFITDHEIPHPALELLFTAGEESGFVGASHFDYRLLKSRIIYNVDSEEEGIVTVGSAGGSRLEMILKKNLVDSEISGSTFELALDSLKGGHSGVDINRNRANALKVISELVLGLKSFHIQLINLSGGSAINTIPREARVRVFVPDGYERDFLEAFETLSLNLCTQYPNERPHFTITKKTIGRPSVMETSDLIDFMNKIPNGVIRLEPSDKNMVRTSSNLGIVAQGTEADTLKILIRSSSNNQLDSVERVMESIGNTVGAKTNVVARYAPWEPKFDSPLIHKAENVYKKIFGQKLKIQTIHAGLECAVFYQKLPDAQIFSFGPSVFNAHTPRECVSISSVEKYSDFLLELIKE